MTLPRPGRFSPDDPEEQKARARLTEGKKRIMREVGKVTVKIPFSYNGKGKQ